MNQVQSSVVKPHHMINISYGVFQMKQHQRFAVVVSIMDAASSVSVPIK